jgi:hypothetical protein
LPKVAIFSHAIEKQTDYETSAGLALAMGIPASGGRGTTFGARLAKIEKNGGQGHLPLVAINLSAVARTQVDGDANSSSWMRKPGMQEVQKNGIGTPSLD